MTDVERGPDTIMVGVKLAPGEGFCPDCGVLASPHGRRRVLHDVSSAVWRS